MPDEPEGTEEVKPEVKPPETNIIENWLDAEDKATDELAVQMENPTADTAVVKEAIPTETPEEEKPSETPPAEPPPDEKPPAPVQEPEKPAPVETKPEPEKQKPWAELRAAQREKKELEAKLKAQEDELARLRAKPAEEPVIDEYQPPATKQELEQFRSKIAENDAKIEQMREATRAQMLADAVMREEQAFEKEHPDYRQAVGYIKDVQLKEFTLSGQLDVVKSDLIQNRADEVERIANMYNVDPEQCAKDLAFQILFEQRKQQFAQRNVGKVASSAYELAQAYGYRANGKEEVKEPAKPEPEKAAQEKVQRAVKNQAVTQSISAMTRTQGPPGSAIMTRQDLMRLDPESRDAYIDEMDRKNSKWLEELE
jgi:hypothetical protein